MNFLESSCIFFTDGFWGRAGKEDRMSRRRRKKKKGTGTIFFLMLLIVAGSVVLFGLTNEAFADKLKSVTTDRVKEKAQEEILEQVLQQALESAGGNGDGNQLTPPVLIPLPLARVPALLQALMGPQLPPKGAPSHTVGKLHLVEPAYQLSGGLGHGGFPLCHVYRADHRLPLGEPFGVVPDPHIAQASQHSQKQSGRQEKQPPPPSDFRTQLGQSEAQGIPDDLLLRLLPPAGRRAAR